MPRHIFIVRATVPDPTERQSFDAWYSREHLPDAVKSFGCARVAILKRGRSVAAFGDV
jgi:hypothetical protein